MNIHSDTPHEYTMNTLMEKEDIMIHLVHGPDSIGACNAWYTVIHVVHLSLVY